MSHNLPKNNANSALRIILRWTGRVAGGITALCLLRLEHLTTDYISGTVLQFVYSRSWDPETWLLIMLVICLYVVGVGAAIGASVFESLPFGKE